VFVRRLKVAAPVIAKSKAQGRALYRGSNDPLTGTHIFNHTNKIKGETNMKTNELRPQEPKTTKMVELKVALPWTIIITVAIATASYIYGWHNSQAHTDQVKAEAASMVKNVKVEVEKVPSKE
jgi:hypothetical protein